MSHGIPSDSRISTQEECEPARIAVASLLFAALSGVYWLVYRGKLYALDEHVTFSSIASLVQYGDTTVNQVAFLRPLLEWSSYSKYDPAQMLLAAPLYWFASRIALLDNVQVVMALNIWLVALVGCLIFLCARRLGWGRGVSLVAALLFGLATGALPATRTFFSEPLTMVCLVLSFYALIRFKQRAKWEYIALGSVGLSLALATRTQNIVALPAFGLYGLWIILSHDDATARRPRGLVRLGMAAAIPLLLWAVGLLLYNQIRYGNPLMTGYGISLRDAPRTLNYSLARGLWEHTLGPAHGLFIYSPLLLASLVGLIFFWRRHRPEATFVIILSASYLVFHALYGGSGGLVWGHRYMLPLSPFLTLSLGPLIQRLEDGHHRQWWAAMGVLIAISVAVQLLSVAVDYGNHFVVDMPPSVTLAMYTNPQFSWLGIALTGVSIAEADFGWLRRGMDSQTVQVRYLPMAITVAWIGLAIVALRCLWPVASRLTRRAAWRLQATALVWVIVGSGVLLLLYSRADHQGNRGALDLLQHIQDQATSSDGLLIVAPPAMQTGSFLGLYDGIQRYVGLDFETPPLRPQVETLLTTTMQAHERLWLGVHGRWPMAADNGVEAWLDRNLYPVKLDWIPDFGYLTLYGRPAEPFAQQSLSPSRSFGTAVELTSGDVTPRSLRPGGIVYIALEWRSLRAPAVDCKVFTQMIDANGRWVAGSDRVPVNGREPCETWQPGQQILDRHAILVPADTPAGQYEISVGLYDPDTGRRLAVGDSDHVSLGQVTIASRGD